MQNDVMTPEEYELLLSLGGENQQLTEEMKMQMLQAQQLRQDMPQGQMAGRVYVAPNILQYAGKLAGDNVANQKQKAAAANQRTIGANTQQQNGMIMRGILSGNQPQGPATMPGAAPVGEDPYKQFRQAGGFA